MVSATLIETLKRHRKRLVIAKNGTIICMLKEKRKFGVLPINQKRKELGDLLPILEQDESKVNEYFR